MKWHRPDIAVDLNMPSAAAVNAAANVAEDVALTVSSDAPDETRESLRRPPDAVFDTDVVSRTPCCRQLLKLVVPCLSPYSAWQRSCAGAVATEHDKASMMGWQPERPKVDCERTGIQRLRCPYAGMPMQ